MARGIFIGTRHTAASRSPPLPAPSLPGSSPPVASAFSPIARVRSASRSCSIHVTPASSGLSTCTAAPAATNRDAISAKFSIDGPNTGILPNAAGSRILCPPDSTRDPPTKTPSANRYNELSLADSIDQQDSHIVGNRRSRTRTNGGRNVPVLARHRHTQLRPSNELPLRLHDEIRRRGKSLRLSRRQHQQRVWKLPLQRTESDECQRFFRGHHAARHNDRRTPAARSFRLQPCRQRRLGRWFLVILQIFAHKHAFRRRPQCPHALCIAFTLHQIRTRPAKRVAQQGPQQKSKPRKILLPSRKRSIRYPPAHKHDGHPAPPSLTQEIWPDLRLSKITTTRAAPHPAPASRKTPNPTENKSPHRQTPAAPAPATAP